MIMECINANWYWPGTEINLEFPVTDMLLRQVFGISDFFASEIPMWEITIMIALITMMLAAILYFVVVEGGVSPIIVYSKQTFYLSIYLSMKVVLYMAANSILHLPRRLNIDNKRSLLRTVPFNQSLSLILSWLMSFVHQNEQHWGVGGLYREATADTSHIIPGLLRTN